METKGSLNSKSYEEKCEFVSRLNLIDDTFCSVVMEDKDACEYLLSALLDRRIEVIENKTQYSLKSITQHSVILDALVKDEAGRVFNVELNSYDDKDHARRLRYYGAMIDCACLEKNQPYKALPDLYMVYISRNDPLFAEGTEFEHRNHYEIGHYVKNVGADYDNGLYIHYFITSVKDSGNIKLTELLEYIEFSDPANEAFGALSEAVNYFKKSTEGVEHMCKIVEDYAESKKLEGRLEGRLEGERKTKLEMIRNMISEGIILDKALKYANLDRKTYEKYLSEQ